MTAPVPEGNGTLADSTLLVYMNTGGGDHHNGSDRHAFVSLGSAGGYFRTGRCLTFAKGAHVNAMGVAVEKFGDQATVKGALPGLRA